ncbi:hypothetical protein M8C21_017667 [Ambrosia artemisiifolia]|uniref:Uncharacterized protein n=1 Tax=Ambrosia artemisiifolia TaxID=4212 RepID=A0AAD5BXG1_AMBAR|nr:hypothetical protein M8C21_017667 [Ambrosia artemisiifolia]
MWVPSALENMAHSSAGRGRSQCGGRGPRGGRGSGQGNCNRGLENGGRPAPEANQLPNERNDNEVDEPVIVVGRGPVVPAPLPTPENRTWIWVEDDEPCGRGPWQGWKDVPSNHREHMLSVLRARDEAKKLASQEDIVVGNDMTRILPYSHHGLVKIPGEH